MNNKKNELELEEESIISQKEFLKKFNKNFEIKQSKRKRQLKKKEKILLNNLKKLKKNKNIHDLTIGEILINTKNTYLNILKDIFTLNFKNSFSNIFTKDDRMFYIGVSLLILSFLIFIISFFISDDKKEKSLDKKELIKITLNNNFDKIKDNNNNSQKIKNIQDQILETKDLNIKNIKNSEINETKSEINTINTDDLNIDSKVIDTSNMKEISL